MSDDRNDNDRQRRCLYEKFRDSIGKPGADTFHDEDDLIDIFDYAADINDDFVRMEVLLAASRLYPDSVPLAERKAYYYYELGNDQAARQAAMQIPKGSALGELLLLRLNGYLEGHEDLLDKWLADHDELDDETMIRLVDVARDLDAFQWLKKRYDNIKKHSDFPQAFIYEMVSYAEMSGDMEFALLMLEELTMLEPFNTEFWILLAEAYSHYQGLEDFEKSQQALDYALAIDPDREQALLLKSDLLHVEWCNDNAELPANAIPDIELDNILTPARRAMTLYPDHPESMARLARLLIAHGRIAEADDLMSEFKRQPATINYAQLEEQWMMWVRNFLTNEALIDVSAQLLITFDRNFGIHQDIDLLFETIYRSKNYAEYVKTFERHYTAIDEAAPINALLYGYSQMALGMAIPATKTMRKLIDYYPSTSASIADRLMAAAIRQSARAAIGEGPSL